MGDLIRFEFNHLSEKAQNLELTKRDVLSLLACIFDPLRLLSPTVAKAKILFLGYMYQWFGLGRCFD